MRIFESVCGRKESIVPKRMEPGIDDMDHHFARYGEPDENALQSRPARERGQDPCAKLTLKARDIQAWF